MKYRVKFVSPIEEVVKEVDKTSFSVGRGQASDLVFLHHELSRKHFSIDVRDNKIFITDLQSSNGTFIKSKQIEPGVPTELQEGDSIGFGGPIDFYFEVSILELKSGIKDSSTETQAEPRVSATTSQNSEEAASEPEVEIKAPDAPEESIRSHVLSNAPEQCGPQVNLNDEKNDIVLQEVQERIEKAKYELSTVIEAKSKLEVEGLSLEENLNLENDKLGLVKKNLSEQLKEQDEIKARLHGLRDEEQGLSREVAALRKQKINISEELKQLSIDQTESKKIEEGMLAEINSLKSIRGSIQNEIDDAHAEQGTIEMEIKNLKSQASISKLPLNTEANESPLQEASTAPHINPTPVNNDEYLVSEELEYKLSKLAKVEESIEDMLRLLEVLEQEINDQERRKAS